MPIDVHRVRRETPGCAHVVHFNNAGAALPPQPVLEAQLDHLRREADIGGYEAAADATPALDHTYEAIATLLNCDADEVAVVENATRAWDMAFYALELGPGDRIMTSPASYASNYIAMLQVARRTGATIDVAPTDATGQVDVDQMRARLDDDVALIALTHAPTNSGLVNPANAVGALARDAGVPFLLDACQSAGQLPLDVEAIGCTMLSATGRKFLRGPRGTGFLYVRRDWIERLEPPMIDLHAATWTAPDTYVLHGDARRFETWEGYVAGKIALGVAVDYALNQGLDGIFARIQHLAARLREQLATFPGVTVHDRGRVKGGITTFSTARRSASTLQHQLRERGFNTSVSPPASTRLDAEQRALPDLVRASVHYYNTTEEIDQFCTAVQDLLHDAT